MSNCLGVIWSLLRPQTYLLMSVYVSLGIAYGLSEQNYMLSSFLADQWLAIVGVYAALALWYIAGTAFNDYADYEIDRVNLKGDRQRPLVTGTVSRRDLLHYGIFATFASLVVIALTTSLVITLLYSAMLVLNVAYSLKPFQISRRGGLAPLLLPLGYIVLTISSGMLLTGLNFSVPDVLILAGMYLHFMARIVLKDHRDVRGDAMVGKKTLILKYGNHKVSLLAMVLFIASTALLALVLSRQLLFILPFIALLSSGATYVLLQLSRENRWLYQKPLITVFGRLCSGIITLIIIGLLPQIIHMESYQPRFIAIVITALFFVSISEIIKLQHPTQ
ncbi:MAG: UbiA family prenyltransferase [Patescibacteria group bacterium]|nr:UbiA family prenyltransferase [Patescibacteria group bacterium]